MKVTNKNTMGKFEYLFFNIFWAFIAFFWHRFLLFIPFDGSTVDKSKNILWALVLVMVLGGMVITFKNRRNCLSLFVNVIFPFEIYSIISYWHFYTMWIKVTLSIAGIFSGIFFVFIVFQKNFMYEHDKSIRIKKKLGKAFLGARAAISICLCVFIVPLAVSVFIGEDLFQADDRETIVFNQTKKWTIENNIETIIKIKPEIWEKISGIEEKLEVLSVLKNVECQHFGINHEVSLSVDSLEKNTFGYYIPNERKIVLDVIHVENDSVHEVIHSLFHEIHHVYSIQQVELYKFVPEEYRDMIMFSDIHHYEKEYDDYIDGVSDYYGYTNQYCEIHANEYANEAVNKYYEAVFRYEERRN